MDKRIHISNIWALMEAKEVDGSYKKFSFQYAKMNGELVDYKDCTLTSIYSKGPTVNIRQKGDVTPKTFRKICITRFNEYKVYL